MPLIKKPSKKAFEHNVKAEMHAGKPQKQSLAIAYSVKRQAAKKKMADGGMAMEETNMDKAMKSIRDAFGPKPSPSPAPKRYAKGGELDARDEHMSGIDEEYDHRGEEMLDDHSTSHHEEQKAASHRPSADDMDSMEMDMDHQEESEDSYSKDGIVRFAKGGVADAILKKRKMASGIEAEELNLEDQLSYDAARKDPQMGDDLEDIHQPDESNEHGDEIEHDKHDMVSAIRRRMKSKI